MTIKQPNETPDFQASIRQQLEAIVEATKVQNLDLDKLTTELTQKAEQTGFKSVIVDIELGSSPENPLTFVLREGNYEPEPTGHKPDYGWLDTSRYYNPEMDAATYRQLIHNALDEKGKPRENARFRPSVRVDLDD